MNTTTTRNPLTIRLLERAIQRAYDAGDITTGQRLQRELGMAKGGTTASGGATR